MVHALGTQQREIVPMPLAVVLDRVPAADYFLRKIPEA
jgi:hypothetical protein